MQQQLVLRTNIGDRGGRHIEGSLQFCLHTIKPANAALKEQQCLGRVHLGSRAPGLQ